MPKTLNMRKSHGYMQGGRQPPRGWQPTRCSPYRLKCKEETKAPGSSLLWVARPP